MIVAFFKVDHDVGDNANGTVLLIECDTQDGDSV